MLSIGEQIYILEATQSFVEADIPGASLDGRDPSELHVVELK